MNESTDRARIHLIVEGRVQGVFFRAATAAEAGRLGVSGWVQNRSDGTVEVLAEGDRRALEALRAWCGHGPPGARVDAVRAQWETDRGEFRGFRVRR